MTAVDPANASTAEFVAITRELQAWWMTLAPADPRRASLPALASDHALRLFHAHLYAMRRRYGIDDSDPRGFARLAFALALHHEPGFLLKPTQSLLGLADLKPFPPPPTKSGRKKDATDEAIPRPRGRPPNNREEMEQLIHIIDIFKKVAVQRGQRLSDTRIIAALLSGQMNATFPLKRFLGIAIPMLKKDANERAVAIAKAVSRERNKSRKR